MGEYNYKWSNWKINFQNIQGAHAAQYQKNEQPNQKLGRRPKQQMVDKHEKMLNITHYQRNANQNYTEVSPHPSQNGHHQQIYKQKLLERVWRKGNLHALLMGI